MKLYSYFSISSKSRATVTPALSPCKVASLSEGDRMAFSGYKSRRKIMIKTKKTKKKNREHRPENQRIEDEQRQRGHNTREGRKKKPVER